MTGRFLSIISALFLFGYFHNGFLLFYGIKSSNISRKKGFTSKGASLCPKNVQIIPSPEKRQSVC